jgi:ribonuclease HI
MITNPNQVEHLGATRATNNTGELSAVCHALTGARELARSGEEVLILSDSQIAICTTTGAWASRKNKALVERNRRTLAALRADGTHVGAVPARPSACRPRNERARRQAGGARGAGHALPRRQNLRSDRRRRAGPRERRLRSARRAGRPPGGFGA